jgi:hypothetical protein
MRTFTDTRGRAWEIRITVAACQRVRDLAQVDLLSAIEGNLLEQHGNDPLRLVEVHNVLLKPQADAAGITDLDLADALDGDAIDAATTAFLEELVGFFRPPRRQALARLLEKIRHLEQKVTDEAIARIDGPAADQLLDAKLRKLDADLAAQLAIAGGSSGSSPDTSASTRGPAPSPNCA